MRTLKWAITAMVCLSGMSGVSCDIAAGDYSPDSIIALERGALDRWGKGDPKGYYEIMASEETYFDPTTAKRIDGLEALKAHIAPFDGKIAIERYEMIDPKVQRDGNIAVLTFNLDDSRRSDRRRRSGYAALEQHRGLSAHRREVEDRPLALVVREAGAGKEVVRGFSPAASQA